MNIDKIYFHQIEELKKPTFSILIPSWNNLHLLKLCIESIRKNSFYYHQIIVHANEATDGTLEWIKENNISYTFSEKMWAFATDSMPRLLWLLLNIFVLLMMTCIFI